MSDAIDKQQNINRQRLLAALDLMDFGIRLMKNNIARQLPDASTQQIDAELRRWMFEQPAEFKIHPSAGQAKQ